MEATNITVEARLRELRSNAASWRSHKGEWTMPLDNYEHILRDISARCDRERKAAYELTAASDDMVEALENGKDTNAPRYALKEKTYIYARIVGHTDYDHAVDAFAHRGGVLLFKHTDADYNGEVVLMTLDELLKYINADHSNEWQDYTAEDWGEGMSEWTDLEIVKW